MQEPATVDIGGHKYRIGRLSTFDQLDVATDLGNVFFRMSILEQGAKKNGQSYSEEQAAQSFCAMCVDLEKSKRDAIFRKCLLVVQRAHAKVWGNVIMNGEVMFQDIDLRELLQIVLHVVKHNGILAFFVAAPVERNQGADQDQAL
jgi:hypothetical protein